MICFELMRLVLDELYAEIPGDDDGKHAAVAERLKLFSEQYKDIEHSPDIEYADPISRFAYVYCYVACHADLVCQMIMRCQDLQDCLARDALSISCIGGGPGSDFVGILKYMTVTSRFPKTMCFILDREKAWNQSWADIASKLDVPFLTNFVPVDVRDPASWQYEKKCLQADLFTMIYFVSEVYKDRGEAETYFHNLLSEAKTGSLLLFIDNSHSKFYEWFDQLWTQHSYERISGGAGRVRISDDEQKELLGAYFDLFGRVKLKPDVAWRVLRKV